MEKVSASKATAITFKQVRELILHPFSKNVVITKIFYFYMI